MKKNGFTLAEVLITLTIIGVIATMTLPALLTNTQEQQAITGLKKGISTLTDAGQMSLAVDGVDFAQLTSQNKTETDLDGARSLYALLASRTNVDLKRSGDLTLEGVENPLFNSAITGIPTPDTVVYLRDGSSILYKVDSTTVSDDADIGERLEDGLYRGFTVIYDTNGDKGPNILSNCLANAAGVFDGTDEPLYLEDDATTTTTPEDFAAMCDSKTSRVIRDQFTIQLRGGNAVPRGAAALWAFNK